MFNLNPLHIFRVSHQKIIFKKMNYAQAVKGLDLNSSILHAIQEQADLEIQRCLTMDELSWLYRKYSSNQLWQNIEKVLYQNFINIYFEIICLLFLSQYGHGFLKFQLFLLKRPDLPCEISHNSTPRDGDCLLHGWYNSFKIGLYISY